MTEENKRLLPVGIIALIVAVIVIFSVFGCGKELPVKVPDSFAVVYTTPNGVNIKSVVAIPAEKQAEVFAAAERGIGRQIANCSAMYPAWNKARRLSDYRIVFINPDRTNQDGSPALWYRNKIQTAGTVIGIRGDGYKPLTIVLPHQDATNWTHLYYLEQAAQFESEHYAEHENDAELFERLATVNDIHPHCP